ncbi:Protein-L-isoaspartate O-methyltransferase [Frankliniella fusca]|uniref:Protein-L-isoaspartate O-methyltransferase n=1 Tax=Frankliniella fusca TaxID=407009 RepID=A0AAE1GTM3_9NEOP|nr:Protein-L-isoaspartate O-methyltransferase [Frankliniella fusca]
MLSNIPNTFPMEMEFPYPEPDTPKRSSGSKCLLQQRPAVEDCSCLDHGPTPEVSYMRYIRAKDTEIYSKMQKMRKAMSSRASNIIDHVCPDDDSKMNAFHIIDYAKRGYAPGCYTSLQPAKVCEAGTPIEPLRIGINDGYREASLFPHYVKSRHIVDKIHPLVFTRTPINLKHWFSPYIPGRSEYEDTISRLGLARMRNTRQYLEPQPSSRLRSGDPNC